MNLKLLFAFLLITNLGKAQQEPIKAKLTNRPFYEIHYGFSPSAVILFEEEFLMVDQPDRSKSIKPIIPEKERASENGILQVLFRGGENDLATLVLVSNYKSENPRFYVDHNQDYNFTNDGTPLIWNGGSIDLNIKNPQVANSEHLIRLVRMSIPNDQVRSNWKRNIKRKTAYRNATLSEPDYWFRELRLNIKSQNISVNGTEFQIGLMDTNINGLFNDPKDRIIIGKYNADTVATDLNSNNYEVGEKTPFAVGNKGFEIEHIDSLGNEIHFKPIDFGKVSSKISIGDELPSITVANLDGTSVELKQAIELGKYNYLEFWGTWCKGCIEELPKLRSAHQNENEKLKIIGLHSGVSGKRLKDFIEKNNITWTQFDAQRESLETLKVNSFPYGILINPKGKIEAFNLRIEEVLKLINE